jgi:MFS family permease
VVTVLAVGGMALVLALRPDPRALAADPAPAGARRPAGAILRRRPAVAAVASIGVGQAVMVTFMGVVPVVIHNHGAANLTVTLIVSLHLAGMFAFSPLIGAVLDRWGRRPGLLAGVLATAAGILLSLSSATLVAAAGLFLVGVGWSAAYLGSTAVVSDLASPTERAGALGLTDLFAASSAAVGVLGTAVLLEVAGFGTVAVIGLALLVLPAVLLIPLREVTPGSWPPAMAEAGRPGG